MQISKGRRENLATGVSNLQPGAACGPTQNHKLKPFFVRQFLIVLVYVMCSTRDAKMGHPCVTPRAKEGRVSQRTETVGPSFCRPRAEFVFILRDVGNWFKMTRI